MKKEGWRGYNFSRLIDGSMIPQRVQNLVIRTYLEGLGLKFLLSKTEYSMPETYMMLATVYDELDSIEGVCLYSVHMLPASRQVRMDFYKNILTRGGGIRFALEALSILSEKDIAAVEELMICKDLTPHVTVDEEFLERNPV